MTLLARCEAVVALKFQCTKIGKTAFCQLPILINREFVPGVAQLLERLRQAERADIRACG